MSEQISGGFKPSAQIDGGTFEFDGIIRSVRTGTFDYPSGATGVGFFADIQSEQEDAQERKEDFYSCGSVGQITPSEDGKGFLDKDGNPIKGLNKNSNGGRFFREAVNGGLQEKDMHVGGNVNDITFLEGKRFHFALIDSAKVGSGKDSKKLFPTKYLGQGSAPSVAPAPNALPGGSFTDAVLAVLAEQGGSVKKADLIQAVSAKFTVTSERANAVRALMSEATLRSIPGTKFDGQSLSLA
jgi:hypothetical protein